MFKIGDNIVHPMYGAGVITDIVKKDFLGENREYYCISLPFSDIETLVPLDNPEKIGMRPLVNKSRVKEVITILNGESETMNSNWNKRYRTNLSRMQTGDILEVAAVVRNLVRVDRKKPLSTGEKRQLNTAKQILESELACVYKLSIEEIDEMVESNI